MAFFGKKYSTIKVKRKEIPEGLWTKCTACGQLIYTKVVEENLYVCPKCNFHFTLGAHERIKQLVDKDTFNEVNNNLTSDDPLEFTGVRGYKEKLKADEKCTGLNSAAVTGTAKLGGNPIILGVTDSRFIMGSMG